MARPEGFEPPTNWFEANYSIQLSYGRLLSRLYAHVTNSIIRLIREAHPSGCLWQFNFIPDEIVS